LAENLATICEQKCYKRPFLEKATKRGLTIFSDLNFDATKVVSRGDIFTVHHTLPLQIADEKSWVSKDSVGT
jgi:hypothetical protein